MNGDAATTAGERRHTATVAVLSSSTDDARGFVVG
jgi:hypothetical protein